MIVKKENGFLKLKKGGIKEGSITEFKQENEQSIYRFEGDGYREILKQSTYDALTNDKGVQISENEDKKESKKRGRPSGSKNQNRQEQTQEPQQQEQQKETPQEEPKEPVNEEQININQEIENDEQNENEPVPGQMEIDQK